MGDIDTGLIPGGIHSTEPPASSPPPEPEKPAEIAAEYSCGTCDFKGFSPGSLAVHIGRSHKKPMTTAKPTKSRKAKASKAKAAAAVAPRLEEKLLKDWKPAEIALALREMARNLEAKAEDYRSVADHLEEIGRDGQAARS